MEGSPAFDLTAARCAAEEAARHWGLALESAFPLAAVSYVAPVGQDLVIKVAWEGDDESLHEPDALELWDGAGAVRLVDRHDRALLMERARPGTDLSTVAEAEATAVAVELATRLWRPAQEPFRPVVPEVRAWIARGEQDGSDLAPLARELLTELGPSADWVVHGDFHHYNVLRHGDRYVAIDPKPYLADREYDVASFLWNPTSDRLCDPDVVESRIEAFVAIGLSDFRIRAWAAIRGSYLRPSHSGPIRELLSRRS